MMYKESEEGVKGEWEFEGVDNSDGREDSTCQFEKKSHWLQRPSPEQTSVTPGFISVV